MQGYRDLDEAIAIANDSEYDLSAGVYTSDLAAATEIVPRIRTGTVQVNTGAANAFTPMGGYKHSGIGRERGVPGIRAFQQVKHVVIGNGWSREGARRGEQAHAHQPVAGRPPRR